MLLKRMYINIKQKLEQEKSGENIIRLHKEGIFYVAYDHSALRFRECINKQVKLLQHQLKNGTGYLRVGVVQDSPILKPYTLKDEVGEWLHYIELPCESMETSLDNVMPDKVIQKGWGNGCSRQEDTSVLEKIGIEIRQTDIGSLTPVQAIVCIERWKKALMNM